MTFRHLVLLLSIWLCGSILTFAQLTESDSKAQDILAQAVASSGAANVQGFSATGTMTYFWGGQEIQSNATIKAKGGNQFRIDADVPGGTRSVAHTRRSGSRKDADGTLSEIPLHNRLNASILTFPYPTIAATLADPEVKLSYVGLTKAGGRQLHQIRVNRTFPQESDPEGILAELAYIDYFIDSETLLVVKASDLTHPKETITESYTHDIEFEGYQVIGGIAVPTVVREKVGGQTTWEFRLSNINFNADMSDAEFSLR